MWRSVSPDLGCLLLTTGRTCMARPPQPCATYHCLVRPLCRLGSQRQHQQPLSVQPRRLDVSAVAGSGGGVGVTLTQRLWCGANTLAHYHQAGLCERKRTEKAGTWATTFLWRSASDTYRHLDAHQLRSVARRARSASRPPPPHHRACMICVYTSSPCSGGSPRLCIGVTLT